MYFFILSNLGVSAVRVLVKVSCISNTVINNTVVIVPSRSVEAKILFIFYFYAFYCAIMTGSNPKNTFLIRRLVPKTVDLNDRIRKYFAIFTMIYVTPTFGHQIRIFSP